MAKAAAKAVAVRKPTTPQAYSPEVQEALDRDAGAGVSTRPEDNVVPLIRRLQKLSKLVDRKHPDYVKGAEPGDIWLRNIPLLIKGDEGFLFQPAAFSKDWVEWRPLTSGGGFVARHQTLPKGAKEERDPKSGRAVFKLGSNELIDTRYHAGFVIVDDVAYPHVLPMKGTDHQVSKDWMVRMTSKRQAVSRKPLPAWLFGWRLTTKERSNPAGTWYTWDIEEEVAYEIDPTSEEYMRGRDLFVAYTSGERRAEVEQEDEPTDDGGTL